MPIAHLCRIERRKRIQSTIKFQLWAADEGDLRVWILNEVVLQVRWFSHRSWCIRRSLRVRSFTSRNSSRTALRLGLRARLEDGRDANRRGKNDYERNFQAHLLKDSANYSFILFREEHALCDYGHGSSRPQRSPATAVRPFPAWHDIHN